jgi:hypothetical protein
VEAKKEQIRNRQMSTFRKKVTEVVFVLNPKGTVRDTAVLSDGAEKNGPKKFYFFRRR